MRPTFEHCIRCTICVENCPVFKVNPEYPGPKQAGPGAQRFRIDGEKSIDKWINMCTQCRRCEQVCPYEVNPAELILKAQIKYTKENKKELLKLMFANYFHIGKLASVFAPIANFFTSSKPGKYLMGLIGLRKDIPFPKQVRFFSFYLSA